MSETRGLIAESERTGADTRKMRVDRLSRKIAELFPGEESRELRENINRSLLVPQVGEFHNEGMFMDSHLDLILRNIESVDRGEFPEQISPAIREMLTRAVKRDTRSVEQYVFLHDIAKADCLTIKRGEEERAMSWKEWVEFLQEDSDGERVLQGDEASFGRFIERHGITGVSYWQKTPEGSRHHGSVGADELREAGFDRNGPMLAAIEAHEVAYQFSRINVKTYENYFGEMSPEARDFALLASYVDTMASVRLDGKPDLTNFLALAGSREKFEAAAVLAERLGGAALDKQKFQRAWSALVGSPEPLTMETLSAVEERLKRECKIAGYDIEKLRLAIEPLITEGVLTEAEREQLLDLAANDPQGIGRAFGQKMRLLGGILKQAAT